MTFLTSDVLVAGEALLAHHPLFVAVPAFAPAIAIAGGIFYIARKDRRDEAAELAAAEEAAKTSDENSTE